MPFSAAPESLDDEESSQVVSLRLTAKTSTAQPAPAPALARMKGSKRAHAIIGQLQQRHVADVPKKAPMRSFSIPPLADDDEPLIPYDESSRSTTTTHRGTDIDGDSRSLFSGIPVSSTIDTSRPFASLFDFKSSTVSAQPAADAAPTTSSVPSVNVARTSVSSANTEPSIPRSSAMIANTSTSTSNPSASTSVPQRNTTSASSQNPTSLLTTSSHQLPTPPASRTSTISAPPTLSSPIRASPLISLPTSAPRPAPASTAFTPAPSISNCFALEGRVTSLAATRDGSYIVAGFASGAVRLFDNTSGANSEVEDRYGHSLGKLETSANFGALNVHVELGYAISVGSLSSSNTEDDAPCHVFAGSRLGSTKLLVADLQSLRRLKQNRGFMTTAAGSVTQFSHTSSQLRGFTSVLPVPTQHDGGKGYTAKYRLFCGRGYGSYYIWEATFIATIDDADEDTYKYSQQWDCLFSGTLHTPNVTFGSLYMSSAELYTSRAPHEYLVYAPDKDARFYHVCCEAEVSDDTKALATVNAYPSATSSKNGYDAIRGITSVHAVSLDGRYVFAGTNDLMVYRMEHSSDGVKLMEQATYSLNMEVAGHSSRRGGMGRHLRQIELVVCANDGQVAVVLCSDNAVLVYSVGGGMFPAGGAKAYQRSHMAEGALPTEGYICLWFQADEKYAMKFGLNYTEPVESTPSATVRDVLVSVGWWEIARPGHEGVLRVMHLRSGIGVVSSGATPNQVPIAIATPLVGLCGDVSDSDTCWLCGTANERHWQAIVDSDAESDPDISCSDSDVAPESATKASRRFEAVSGSARKPQESILPRRNEPPKPTGGLLFANHVESDEEDINSVSTTTTNPVAVATSKRKANKNKEVSRKRNNARQSLPIALDEQQHKMFWSRIHSLEEELERARQETAVIMRKADKRFNEEKRTRRAWNEEREQLESALETANVKQQQMIAKCTMFDKMYDLMSSFAPGSLPIVASSSESAVPRTGHFCVVCQDNTANTAILHCGHICLCYDHALRMQSEGQLSSCPLCKKSCDGVCKLSGV